MLKTKSIWKKIEIRDSQTETVEIAQLWRVEWFSIHGKYADSVDLNDYKKEVAIFRFEDEATAFRDALKDAFKLLRCEGCITDVKLVKEKV